MSNEEKATVEMTVVETIEEAEKKPYELRPLKDSDLWPVLDIFGAVMPDDLAPVLMQIVNKEKTVDELGAVVVYRLVVAVLKNMSKVDKQVYEFLSGISGIPAEDIPNMAFGTTPRMIWDCVKSVKNESFFKELSKLL